METQLMSYPEFRKKVRQLLETQRRYFKQGRKQSNLQECIALETELRKELEKPDEPEAMTEQEFKDRLSALDASELEEQIGMFE